MVMVHDPLWSRKEAHRFPFSFTDDLEEATSGADCIILATEHQQYKEKTLPQLFENVNKPAILIDGRKMFETTQMMNIKDIRYVAIGEIPSPNV